MKRFPWYKRLGVAFCFGICCTSTYLLCNHFPFMPIHSLWMSPLDLAIPMMIWTIWPYMWLLLSDLMLPLFIRDYKRFVFTMRAYALSMVLNAFFWAFLPTTFPRPDLPTGDSGSEVFYRWVVGVDTPLNCFPSGHISAPAILSWALTKEYPKYAWFIWATFGLLSITILTTRQHYIADLIGGLISAWIGYKASRWWERRSEHLSQHASLGEAFDREAALDCARTSDPGEN